MKEWAGLVVRLVLGAVWLYAGAAKVFEPAQSVAAVRAYELLPGSLAEPVGHLLPVVEVAVGAMLVLGLLTRAGAVVSAFLFVLFIIGIASVWARGMTIDCGCFGGGGYDPDAAEKYPWEIARDAVLLLLSLLLAWRPATRLSLDARLFGRAAPPAPPAPEGP